MTSTFSGSAARSRPRLGPATAERLARELWGIDGSASELPGEADRNFRIASRRGDFVLKVGDDDAPAEIEREMTVLDRLGGRASLPVPPPQRSRDGRWLEEVEDDVGRRCRARLLGWLPGRLLSQVRPRRHELLVELGRRLGELDRALADLDLEPLERDLDWDLRHAGRVLERGLGKLATGPRRDRVERVLERFREIVPRLEALPRSLVHNDANDNNVLVELGEPGEQRICGLLDFGDMVETATVSELAVALAYVTMGERDPLAAAAPVVAGYHGARPLDEAELELLFDLVLTRLAASLSMAAWQSSLEPDNDYLRISEREADATLRRLLEVPSGLGRAVFRDACGLPGVAAAPAVARWLAARRGSFAPLIDGLTAEAVLTLDLGVASPMLAELGQTPSARRLATEIERRVEEAGATIGVGAWDEPRLLYDAAQFRSGAEPRTVHVGVDLFAPAATPVRAPLAGEVAALADNDRPLDYGPTLILRHLLEDEDGTELELFTLYGHLARRSLERLRPGQRLAAGEVVAELGDVDENGGWAPHLHFQLITDWLGFEEGDFPGVAPPGQRSVWRSLSPDPSDLLGFDCRSRPGLEPRPLLERRRRFVGPNLSVSYRTPLKIVRGAGARLWDHEGRSYLDLVNNVCHVGHSRPEVVRALREQAAVLNTNTRYLHDGLVRYVQRLLSTFPEPLRVCYLVCSGSEANDLALRLARTFTGRHEVVTLEGAYHGHLTSLIDVSPYKHDGPGGGGTPPGVHKVPIPDLYRGRWRRSDPEAASKYAATVRRAVVDSLERGAGIAAFFCESLPGCAGQIELPEGYLAEAFAAVREGGGLCVADEVQVGFGRVGSHAWGFESQGVVPDIVTLGKPIGNGHPMAAVITRREIADAFDNGMEYFNTFGGNPVSCAVGLAVLDVLEKEGLQQRAHELGERFRRGLVALAERHQPIGDVRGRGLYLGVELVRCRQSLEPADLEAAHLVERMKERGFLLSTDGPHHNVIKIKPPMVLTEADVDATLEALDETLGETALRPGEL